MLHNVLVIIILYRIENTRDYNIIYNILHDIIYDIICVILYDISKDTILSNHGL